MKKLIDWCGSHDCRLIKKLQLMVLMNASAKAFGRKPERVFFMSFERALEAYALASRRWLDQGADGDDIFAAAEAFGRRIRRISGLSDEEDLKALVFILYKNINISMSGRLPGEIMVSSCYFADHYTPDNCRLMSLFDAGVITGIFGGGSFCFTERLTDKCGCCKAALMKGE